MEIPLGYTLSGGGGGGTTPGALSVKSRSFAFNTPNILTGASLYTPTIGEIIYDAWVEVPTTPWNGTTPHADVLVVGFPGWLDTMTVGGFHYDMTLTWSSTQGMLTGYPNFPNSLNPFGAAGGNAVLPSIITSTTPIGVVVSQTGKVGGADPGSTQGAGVLYLVTITP